jgi:hypothetical protein
MPQIQESQVHSINVNDHIYGSFRLDRRSADNVQGFVELSLANHATQARS